MTPEEVMADMRQQHAKWADANARAQQSQWQNYQTGVGYTDLLGALGAQHAAYQQAAQQNAVSGLAGIPHWGTTPYVPTKPAPKPTTMQRVRHFVKRVLSLREVPYGTVQRYRRYYVEAD